ncbi:PREDICTED: olfactory receptor 6F1-like [Nanorana parkeri]|uniref:olfactory receptor 6F1-like n=1 Tax=Nanorana parkeri TaxID=125878 RepID=UPI0008549F3F|nr:PREDICTED: olfactory receptor 6F1-like [Nanorana parkeri]
MEGQSNETVVTEFIILGFPSLKKIYPLMFLLFLLIYIFTITGNLTIFITVLTNHKLQIPMFFFLNHLSAMEIWYTSVIVPKMLSRFLTNSGSISFNNCMIQLYLFSSLGASECYLLTAMAYDRYLAICQPLHYVSKMTNLTSHQLASGSWIGGFISPILPVVLISKLNFCGPNQVNYFYCDSQPLLKLSCSSTRFTETAISTLATGLIFTSFLLTVLSYIFIISTILRIPSATGRKKSFSTCASHLTVVMIYYGTITAMYMQPMSRFSLDINKVLSLLYTVVTPLVNPIIYSLRNQEMKHYLRKLFGEMINKKDSIG